MVELPKVNKEANLFSIVKKEYQIVQKKNSQEFFIIVKTIEESAKPNLSKDAYNFVKTLRIFKCKPQQNKFKQTH